MICGNLGLSGCGFEYLARCPNSVLLRRAQNNLAYGAIRTNWSPNKGAVTQKFRLVGL
jgi:hypothetical protein